MTMEPGAAATAALSTAEVGDRNAADSGGGSDVVGVTLHKADPLPLQLGLLKPFVRVTIVDHTTGEILRVGTAAETAAADATTTMRDNNNNSGSAGVVAAAERRQGSVTAQTTKWCDLRARRTLAPTWEETILCDVDFAALSVAGVDATVVFEIVDAAATPAATASGEGWIGSSNDLPAAAWAFMRCRGPKGQDNTGSRARLQLFLPPASARSRRRQQPSRRRRPASDGGGAAAADAVALVDMSPAVGRWLVAKGARTPIKGSLYVTVKAVPTRAMEAARLLTRAGGGADGRASGLGGQQPGAEAAHAAREQRRRRLANPSWQRLEGQLCQLPMHPRHRVDVGSKGCFSLAFSNDGTRLAAACCDGDAYPIRMCVGHRERTG